MDNHGFHDLREEILENLWNREEDGNGTPSALLELFDEDAVTREMERMATDRLLQGEGGDCSLTPQGRERARHLVRANRLAARLLADILELPVALVETQACRLEHAISPQVADSLCTIMGHPPTSPTGHPIPRGDCCHAPGQAIFPAVVRLTGLKLGASGRVTFIHPRISENLDHLYTFGLIPGSSVRLRQNHPSVVVEVGETVLALDAEVAREIFVKPVLPRPGRRHGPPMVPRWPSRWSPS